MPEGTYRTEMTLEGLVAAGASQDFARPNAGTWTWTFGDGTWSAEHGRERCSGTVEPVDGVIGASMLVDAGCGMEYVFRWREVDGGIKVQFVGINGLAELTERQRANERAFLERLWVRIP